MLRQVAMGAVALALAVLLGGGCAGLHGRSTEVVFESSDGVKLAGTLVLPGDASGPVPGVVLFHGAEAATRSMAYRMHANIFVDRGMAVLLYDKRGAGESGGDHDSATYADLVEDGLAAVGFLRGRPEVDPQRLGLVGASESGWLTPELAERAGGIAFVINKVGPCDSWRKTASWELYHEMLDAGVGEAGAREQAAVYERIWDYHLSPSEEKRLALEATLGEWAERKESRLPTEIGSRSAAVVEDMRYDPTPFLERGTTPIFYVYGSEDVNIPTARCVERLGELQQAGRPVSYHVFDGAGHELGGVGVSGYRFVEGYEALLGDFAERRMGEAR